MLFDFDDTLLDFQRTEPAAFLATVTASGLTHTPELYTSYREISEELWRQVALNTITKEELKVRRFERLLTKHALAASALTMGEYYLKQLAEHIFLVEAAREVCEALLHGRVEMGIVTNGIQAVQETRLARSGLAEFISFMVVSEACGFNKPDRRIFEYALTRAKTANRVLVVGDRLETDIAGAVNAGLDSCWYNPNGLPLTGEARPTHEIRHLRELCALVL